MTLRNQKFIEAYLRTGNATEAAKAAGYSEKTAAAQGHRLLRNAEICAALEAARTDVLKELRLEASDVLREFLHIARSDVGQLFDKDGKLKPIHKLDECTRRAIESIVVEGATQNSPEVTRIKLWSKNDALDKLSKHLGIYAKDNAQVAATFADLVLKAQRLREKKESER